MKKVLIITYYWPPAGGPGVQRVLKFANYLPQFGWEPIILTVENGEYPAIDESLLEEIPPNLKVYKTNSLEPFSFYKKLTGKKGNIPTHVLSKSKNESFVQKISKWIRANIFIPDARLGWVPQVVKEGMKIIEREKPELIFSSSPPHSLQLGAMKLAEKCNLKWIADLRDPWTDGFWQKDLARTKFAVHKDLQKEKEVLSKADAITTVSKSLVELFTKKIDNRYFVLPNGFEEKDFESIEKQKQDYFDITYTGSLRESQIPQKFFEAASSLKKYGKAEKLRINFIGTVHPDAIKLIEDYGLQEIVNFINYLPHKELPQHLVNADMLLLSIPNTPDNKGILTGKLFEYIGSKNFILCFGPKKGNAAEIIDSLNCGITFEFYEDPKDFILQKYNEWVNGSVNVSEHDIQKYTRRNLTKKLAEVFDSLI